jgi:hypothetical protein
MTISQTRSSSKIFLSSGGINKTINSSTINTDITFYFDPILLPNVSKEHFVLGLEQASIPVSIYMINSTNNVMVINATTYTIPVGNYTITSLIAYLNGVNATIQFEYLSVSNQVKVTITPTASVVISGSASAILGFVAGTYSNPHTFTNVVNLTSTTGIIIQIENVTTTNRDNSGRTGATLARIPITCATLKILQYFNATPFYTQIGNRELTYLRVRLLNDDYSPLILVGNPPWFLVVRVDYTEKTTIEDSSNEFKNIRAEQNRLQIQANIDALSNPLPLRKVEPKSSAK